MRIPLYKRLKRQFHRDIGAVQDAVVELVYSLEENAVLHGGTAIWRCFQGNRFSEDLDFYFLPKKRFKESFSKELDSLDLGLGKFKATDNAIYSKIARGNIIISLEVLFQKPRKPIVMGFEKMDGNYLDVFTLSPEDLLLEKLNAFKNRKLIRDIYDAYHLSKFVKDKEDFNKKVRHLLVSLPLPLDEKSLRNVVLAGAVPSYAQMLQSLKRRFSK